MLDRLGGAEFPVFAQLVPHHGQGHGFDRGLEAQPEAGGARELLRIAAHPEAGGQGGPMAGQGQGFQFPGDRPADVSAASIAISG